MDQDVTASGPAVCSHASHHDDSGITSGTEASPMLSFTRVAIVMVSLHKNRTGTKKLLPGVVCCCDRSDHAPC